MSGEIEKERNVFRQEDMNTPRQTPIQRLIEETQEAKRKADFYRQYAQHKRRLEASVRKSAMSCAENEQQPAGM